MKESRNNSKAALDYRKEIEEVGRDVAASAKHQAEANQAKRQKLSRLRLSNVLNAPARFWPLAMAVHMQPSTTDEKNYFNSMTVLDVLLLVLAISTYARRVPFAEYKEFRDFLRENIDALEAGESTNFDLSKLPKIEGRPDWQTPYTKSDVARLQEQRRKQQQAAEHLADGTGSVSNEEIEEAALASTQTEDQSQVYFMGMAILACTILLGGVLTGYLPVAQVLASMLGAIAIVPRLTALKTICRSVATISAVANIFLAFSAIAHITSANLISSAIAAAVSIGTFFLLSVKK